MKERPRQHPLETLRHETTTDSNFYVSCISQRYELDKQLYRKVFFTDYNMYFISYFKIHTNFNTLVNRKLKIQIDNSCSSNYHVPIHTLTPDTAVERKLKLLIDNTCSSNYHVPSGYHKLEKSYRCMSGYDPSSISVKTYNIIAENKFNTLERIDRYSRRYHPYTKSRKATRCENKTTPEATLYTISRLKFYNKEDQVALVTADGECPLEGRQKEYLAPQWTKVFLGGAQLLCNAPLSLSKKGSRQTKETSPSPVIFIEYFDIDKNTIKQSFGLILNNGSTTAINSTRKIGFISDVIRTISTEDIMTNGFNNTILSALYPNKYSIQYSDIYYNDLLKTNAIIEAMQLIMLDELAKSLMNLKEMKITNELSAFVASLHRGLKIT